MTVSPLLPAVLPLTCPLQWLHTTASILCEWQPIGRSPLSSIFVGEHASVFQRPTFLLLLALAGVGALVDLFVAPFFAAGPAVGSFALLDGPGVGSFDLVECPGVGSLLVLWAASPGVGSLDLLDGPGVGSLLLLCAASPGAGSLALMDGPAVGSPVLLDGPGACPLLHLRAASPGAGLFTNLCVPGGPGVVGSLLARLAVCPSAGSPAARFVAPLVADLAVGLAESLEVEKVLLAAADAPLAVLI